MTLPPHPAALQNSELFTGVDLQLLDDLLAQCSRRSLASGDALLEPGGTNSNLYLVLSGQLRPYLGGRVLPDTPSIEPGQCTGMVSALDGGQTATLVLASVPTEVLVIPADILQQMMDRPGTVARNLLLTLAKRLRAENGRLLEAQNRILEFRQAASIDPLTGLHNRRWLVEAFARTLRRCEQDNKPACLLMVDIDHFKRINDVYGHRGGDHALRTVGRRLSASLRSQDLIARYGGDEFTILLPGTGAEDAYRIAERLRSRLAEAPTELDRAGTAEIITLSCGVASRLPGMHLDELLTAADRALYQAKQGGRNRLARAEDH